MQAHRAKQVLGCLTMKSYLQAALCLCLTLTLFACDDLSQKQDQAQSAKRPEPTTETPALNGRFVPIAPAIGGSAPMAVPWHGFFALDTRTGMLCRTVNREFPKDEWATELTLCNAPASSEANTKLTPEQEKMLDKVFGPVKKRTENKTSDSNK
jgi:hypothetical protein